MSESLIDPGLVHLARLTDDTSIFEHARGAIPRREHGYCTDDAGRALIVAVRSVDPRACGLAERYLGFLAHMHLGDGRFALRMGFDRTLTHGDESDDACGRAIQGLGVAAASAPWPHVRAAAFELFCDATPFRSSCIRAMAHAGVGAAEVLATQPDHAAARLLARDAMERIVIPFSRSGVEWPWPEARLGYGNALLAECAMVTGAVLGDDRCVKVGLTMLRWLAGTERAPQGWLSVTPVNGWAAGEPRPAFDQQPLEAACLADAARRARTLTGDHRWDEIAQVAEAWFTGANDLGVAMVDPSSGGGYDGLCPDGPNRNQGAESTLAMLVALHCQPPNDVRPDPRATP